MKNAPLIGCAILVGLLSGCATASFPLLRPTGRVLTQGYGSADLAKYKSFSAAVTSQPNTPEFYRDQTILALICKRFIEEGFYLTRKIDAADFLITMSFVDATGQKYIPPTTYTAVSYDPGTTTTQTTGTTSSFGGFGTLNATSVSTSTASATVTSTTTGGYFIPTYGIGVVVNIYDAKSKQLVWSGVGAREAKADYLFPAVDDIVLTLIDKYLITPAYLAGSRAEIRKRSATPSEPEYLKPDGPTGFYPNTYKKEVQGIGALSSISADGSMLTLTLSLKNNTADPLPFDPGQIKVLFKGEELTIFSKSEMADFFMKATRPAGYENAGRAFGAGGIVGLAMASVYNSSEKSRMDKRDTAIKYTYEHYLTERTISPGENYVGYVNIAGPIALQDQDKILLKLPIKGEKVEAEYVYEKGWMTASVFKKRYGSN